LKLDNLTRLVALLILVAGATLIAPLPADAASAVQLPLSLFLSAQGTTNGYLPPVPDYIAWTGRPPDYPRLGSIDYAGLANNSLVAQGGTSVGTQISGAFLRRLYGGKYQYELDLYTTNAISFMLPNPSPPPQSSAPLLFGARVQEILAGAAPALGDCHFRFVWRESKDGFIPDAFGLITGVLPPGFELVEISFRGTASGIVHAAAGVNEGTPGTMVISETGLFQTQFQGATGDGFPAEVVDLHATGGGRPPLQE
jgi:hypothetical protein